MCIFNEWSRKREGERRDKSMQNYNALPVRIRSSVTPSGEWEEKKEEEEDT